MLLHLIFISSFERLGLNQPLDHESVPAVVDRNHPNLLQMATKEKTLKSYQGKDWWSSYLPIGKAIENLDLSSKMLLLLSLLNECQKVVEKVLIFSQNLNTLDYIQAYFDNTFNSKQKISPRSNQHCIHGRDYFRIDGGVSADKRSHYAIEFNKPTSKAKIFLISTSSGAVAYWAQHNRTEDLLQTSQ